MTALRPLTDTVWASPQLALADLPALAAQGIKRIVNNRPDGEEPGQPTSAEMEAAARAAGLDYLHAPIAGMPGPDAVRAVGAVLEADEPVVMYCRSGTRSTFAWALATRMLGRAEPDAIRQAAADAGYDLSRLPL